ncbi:MAG TPA: response regulator [Longimicrobiales bacterium]|nr:response regulator [Longimicrobiales bacterium]
MPPAAPILLVEDDALLRQAFRILLEDAGYRVNEAGTAADAIESASRDTPALVVLDMGLPDRPGLDVARELRLHDATQTIPIIALTGRVGPQERDACLAAGCTEYQGKPLQPGRLLERLNDLLD